MFKTCTAKGVIRANASQPIENFPQSADFFYVPHPICSARCSIPKTNESDGVNVISNGSPWEI